MIKRVITVAIALAVMVYMVGAAGCPLLSMFSGPVSVTGKIVDSDGKPVKDASVTTVPATTTTKTDAEGVYFIPNVKDGDYKVTAKKDGAEGSAIITTGGAGCAGGGQIPVSDITLQKTTETVKVGSVTVTVKDKAGNALEGVAVTGSNSDGSYSGTTGSDGKVTSKDIKPGTYKVTATKTAYTDTEVTGIEVKADETKSVDLVIYKNDSVTPADVILSIFLMNWNVDQSNGPVASLQESSPESSKSVMADLSTPTDNNTPLYLADEEKIIFVKPDNTEVALTKQQVQGGGSEYFYDLGTGSPFPVGASKFRIVLGTSTFSYDHNIPAMLNLAGPFDNPSYSTPDTFTLNVNDTAQMIAWKRVGTEPLPDPSQIYVRIEIAVHNNSTQAHYMYKIDSQNLIVNISGDGYYTTLNMTTAQNWEPSKPANGSNCSAAIGVMMIYGPQTNLTHWNQTQGNGPGSVIMNFSGTSRNFNEVQ